MNAHVALLEPDAEAAPRAETLTRTIPAVLRLIGKAARVERVNLLQTRAVPSGEPLRP